MDMGGHGTLAMWIAIQEVGHEVMEKIYITEVYVTEEAGTE